MGSKAVVAIASWQRAANGINDLEWHKAQHERSRLLAYDFPLSTAMPISLTYFIHPEEYAWNVEHACRHAQMLSTNRFQNCCRS